MFAEKLLNSFSLALVLNDWAFRYDKQQRHFLDNMSYSLKRGRQLHSTAWCWFMSFFKDTYMIKIIRNIDYAYDT